LASAEQHHTTEAPPRLPEVDSRRLMIVLIAAAVIALVAGAVFSGIFGSGIEEGSGLRRFFLSYLTAFGFALSIVLGALFFVLLQHVTRAGWSVAVRRVPEALANSVPVLAILSIPILVTFLFPGDSGAPTLYPWAAHHDESAANTAAGHEEVSPAAPEAPQSPAEEQPDEAPTGRVPMSAQETSLPDSPLLTREALTAGYAREHLESTPLTRHKARWLNPLFFTLRIVLYFTVWIVIAGFYWRNSVLQDSSGDPALTTRMQKWAPLCLLAYAATVTGAAFDLWMSIDPHFFSTIFAGYIFAGAVIGSLSVIILVYHTLCSRGMLHESINREHFHDLGKLLFTFVFFWGYIAFSQFMLIWYANIPETTYWFGVRGATTVDANFAFGDWPAAAEAPAPVGWWSIIILTLLFAHLLIPFAGLLSRHVKRNRTALVFWSVWMLVMHYLDHYWLIMPEAMVGGWRVWPLPELFTLLFMVGAVGGYFLWTLSGVALRPAADPRLHESLAFHNI
jgi:hypothetical protein